MSSVDSLLAAFRDWAEMDALPVNVRDGIEASIRVKAQAYGSGGVFTVPNSAILISASR